MPQSCLCKQMEAWGCLVLGVSAWSRGALCLPALGPAVCPCASPVVALQISRSLPAACREQPCLELFIRSLRGLPVLSVEVEQGGDAVGVSWACWQGLAEHVVSWLEARARMLLLPACFLLGGGVGGNGAGGGVWSGRWSPSASQAAFSCVSGPEGSPGKFLFNLVSLRAHEPALWAHWSSPAWERLGSGLCLPRAPWQH